MPSPRLPLLLAAAALIAGCGANDDTARTPAPEPRAAQPISANSGQLRVGATEGGVGDATVGTESGIEVLPDTRVPGESNTEQGVGAGASCENADLTPDESNLAAVQAATLCLLNGERADAGLLALNENPKLAVAATVQSKAMVDGQFFDHVGANGSDPVSRIRKAGYIPAVGTWTVGENLAWGTGPLSTPKAIMAAWMKSEGHRDNILRPEYKEIGLGVVAGNPRSRSGTGATFATTFGAVSVPASASKKKAKPRKARAARARAARRSVRASISKG